MSKPEAPVDNLTHFPLPFIPSHNLPPAPPPGDMRYDPTVAGYHHTIFTDDKLGKPDIGVQAAIDSRLQWTLKRQHRPIIATGAGLVSISPAHLSGNATPFSSV